MTTTTQDRNGKGFGPNQAKTQPQPKTSSQATSQAEGKNIKPQVAGMRQLTDDSLADVKGVINELTDDYMAEAQDLVDDVSQRLYDMASGRLLYQAIGDNVAYLMSTEAQGYVEKPSLGERKLKPLRFKLLRQANSTDLSRNALEAGED